MLRSPRLRVETWLLIPVLAFTSTAALAADPEAAAPAAIEERALEIVRRMSERLAGAERLRVAIDLSYDAVQGDGEVIEYGATRRLALKRPDHLRVDAETRDGEQRLLSYDGRQLAFADVRSNVYATVARSGDLDSTLAYLHDELGIPTPLAELFSKDLPELLARESDSGVWVDRQAIDGVLCDHLAFRSTETGLQLWIAAAGEPLPQRIVIVYESAPGRPQFRANLRDWDLSPWLRDSHFAFAPPKGAERIYFRRGAVVVPGMEGLR
jgi:hypothetical protein